MEGGLISGFNCLFPDWQVLCLKNSASRAPFPHQGLIYLIRAIDCAWVTSPFTGNPLIAAA